MSEGRATWVFRSGRRERLEAPGHFPTEFFYGLPELRERGWKTGLLEDADLEMGPPLKPLPSLVNKFSRFCGHLPLGMAMGLAKKHVQKRLPTQGPLIATTNNLGLALGLGRVRGWVRCPVVLVAMGLLPLSPSRWQLRRIGQVLEHIQVVTISKSEQAHLAKFFPERTIDYIPFGVDTRFWQSAEGSNISGNYVLAIGNDANRDWKTLLAAWDETLPPLKIVTSLPVPPAPPNVEVIRGDWRKQTLSDQEILKLYQNAMCVVVPLRNTIQPAGQSVCLQAMACGRPVVISDIAGLWDRTQFVDRKNWWLARPGEACSLRRAVGEVIAGAERLGKSTETQTRAMINGKFSTREMAASIEKLLCEAQEKENR
jgi:glycosyltransferase involved in cell wall biosynthesis